MKNCEVSVSSKTPDSGTSGRTCSSDLHSAELHFRASLDRIAPRAVGKSRNLLIALSGGVDSVALLSLSVRLQEQNAVTVRAVYIDHGLQHQSIEWGNHCAALCKSLAVPFEQVEVTVDRKAGLSPEAAARDARYSAFEKLIKDGEYLCTAHHADDQAETLLLQLFRGAGINGLASMPELREFGDGYLLRPLLQVSQAEITDYAKQIGLSWCEDPSNKDLRYDRNYVRRELLPAIAKRWPQVTQSIARSASHCAEAQLLTSELAVQDSVRNPADSKSTMSVQHLRTLSVVRQKNLLRHWVSQCGFQAPSTVQLQQIFNDLVAGGDDGQGRVGFGVAEIARYQDDLYLASRGSFDPLPDFEYQWLHSEKVLTIEELDWQLDAAEHVNLKPYIGKPLLVRNRRGGERWRPDPDGHSTQVKSLLQQRRVPPWMRSRLLFVFHGENLIDICGPGFTL